MGAIAASDKIKYQYVDYGDADGVVLGQSKDKKVGLHGYTPVSQAVSTSVAKASAADFVGATNATDSACVNCAALATSYNALVAKLAALGVIASS